MRMRTIWCLVTALLLSMFVAGCQNTESEGKNFSIFGQKSETPTTVNNSYYVFNGPAVPKLPTSQPGPDPADANAPVTVADGSGATVGASGGRYTQIIVLRSDIGTTNSQVPTGSNAGTQSTTQTPTQTTEARAGINATLQAQGMGLQQANPSATGEGPSSATGAPQSATPSVNLNTGGTRLPGNREPDSRPAS